MPLVRIDIKRNTDASYARKLGKVVYDSMKAAINVPDQDNFGIMEQLPPASSRRLSQNALVFDEQEHFSWQKATW